MIEQIDHVNLVVYDLEAMTEFYCKVLGFRISKAVTISGGWIDAVVGLTDVLAKVVYLELPEGPRVELIRYERPVASQEQVASLANRFGLRHLAFRVSNIEQAFTQFEKVGVCPISSVVTVPQAQVQYADCAQKRLFYFHDPEGNLLELCEYKAEE